MDQQSDRLSEGLRNAPSCDLAEQAPVMIWATDGQGQRQFFNRRWQEFTGLTAGQLAGGAWLDCVHPADRASLLAISQQAIADQTGFSASYRLRRADGQFRQIQDTGSPRYQPDGALSGYVGVCFDVTARRQALRDLHQSEARFRTVFERAAIAIGVVDVDTKATVECNPALERMLGYSAEEISRLPWTTYTHPDDLEPNLTLHQRLLRGEIDHFVIEKRFIHRSGQIVWGRLTASLVLDHGQPLYVVGLVEDITEHKLTRERLSWTESLLRAAMASPSPFGYYAVDRQSGRILYFNQRFCQIWGIVDLAEEMMQGSIRNSQLLERCQRLVTNLPLPGSIGDQEQTEDELQFHDGRTVRRFSTRIRDEAGHHLGRFYVFEDITERKQLEQALLAAKQEAEVLACTDYLTGLLNRRAFMDRFGEEMNRAKRSGGQLSLILADVDGFKAINDRYGHLAGDVALQRFAQCLREHCRRYDFIARYGGEEFIICLPQTTREQATMVAERIRLASSQLLLQVPHRPDEFRLTASLGVATLDQQRDHDEDWLIKLADDAMYRAKSRGNSVEVANE